VEFCAERFWLRSLLLLIYAQDGIDDMTISNVHVVVKFSEKWFYKPAICLAQLYVFLGGSAEKASEFVANNCFSVKVIK
jgi:hypothetical protein